MRKFITGLTTAATLSLAVVPTLGLLQTAHAAEARVAVSLVGVDLSHPRQAANFRARVDAAADTVCHDLAGHNPGGEFTIAGCKAAARKQAFLQLSASQREALGAHRQVAPIAVAAR